jgi:hypothetical protein
MTHITNTFLESIKKRCESKAKEMAALELSVWDSTHDKELKTHFGFTDKSLSDRKSKLNSLK